MYSNTVHFKYSGALDGGGGGPQCRLLILRNDNVPCRYFSNVPVDLRIAQCHLSILRNGNVPCHYFLRLPVDFKIVQCRLLNLREGCVVQSNLRVKAPYSGPLGPPLSGPYVRLATSISDLNILEYMYFVLGKLATISEWPF